MSDVRTLLKKRPLLFDGGMGTYYKGAPGRECEQANRLDPEGIRAVHRAYLAAGADAIKTNTFGLPRIAAGVLIGCMIRNRWKFVFHAVCFCLQIRSDVQPPCGPQSPVESGPIQKS